MSWRLGLSFGARGWRWAGLTVLASGILLAPATFAAVQEDAAVASGSQVIAQGITRLPKGDLAWTVGRLDVPGEDGTAVMAFPVGFALADGAAVSVLDDGGQVLDILDDGEAAFLPSGKGGALASWRDESASVYDIALVSAADAGASELPVTIVGNPFSPPEGRAFEIELSRAVLGNSQQVTIPVSPSGAPTLYLQTAGTAQLAPPGGEPVELTAGQFALLLGEVNIVGTSDTTATFVAAAIGETTGTRDAAASGTPKAKKANGDREARQGARAGGGQGAGAAKPAKVKKPKGGGRQGGGGRGQGQQQQPGAGNAPVTGGTEAQQPAGTPAAEPLPQETIPASPAVPTEETAPDAGTPPAATTTTDQGTGEEPAAEGTPPAESTAGEETITSDTAPPAETTAPEETLPIDEAPAAEAPVEDAPVEEAPAADVPVGEVPADQAPADQAPVEGEPTVDVGSGG